MTKTEESENHAGPSSLDALLTVLVWDAYDATVQMLDSIERGVAVRAAWTLMILDQGSDTRTARALGVFAQRHGDNVRLDRVRENLGYPAGHNRLLRQALVSMSHRYLVTLNNDIVFRDPAWLDRLVDFMDANPRVGIAGPAGVVYQREPPERIGWCRTATKDEMAHGKFDAVSGSHCIIRQAMIDQIGLFDESFTPGYYEDTDLSFRARACGWRLAHCPVDHTHQALGPEKSTSYLKRQELAARFGNFQKRNRDLFVARWLSEPVAALAAGDIPRCFPKVFLPVPSEVRC